MKHPVGHTHNKIAVYVDLIHSEAAKHIAEQPHLLSLVAEALHRTTLHGTALTVECDMGRAVGYDFVVSTTGADNVFYAQPLREDAYIRFIKNGKPLSTQSITLILHSNQDKDGTTYELQDAWIGHLSPPRPGVAGETAESKSYWENHAYVLSNQTLQLQTITRTCPY